MISRQARLMPALAGILALLAGGCQESKDRPPEITVFEAAPPYGDAPLRTILFWEIADPDGDQLTCEIDVNGDGQADTRIEGCTSRDTHELVAETEGGHRITLSVSDGTNTVKREITVHANSCPMPPGVFYPEQHEGLREVVLEDGHVELLYRDPTIAPEIVRNLILVGTSHTGYLRRVTGVFSSISTAGLRYQLTTEELKLEQLVPECYFGARRVRIPFTELKCVADCDQVAAVSHELPPIEGPKGGVSVGASFDFVKQELEGGGAFTAGLDVSVEISEFVLDIRRAQLQELTVELKPSATGRVNLSLPLPGISKSASWSMGEYVLGAITLGPVVITPMFKLKADVNLSMEPKYQIGASLTVNATAGARWRRDQGWEHWESVSLSPSVIDPKFELGAGSLKAGVQPELSLRIYGLAGPFLRGDLYAKASATADLTEGEVCVSAKAGADLLYGVNVDIFFATLGYEETIPLWEQSFFDQCWGGRVCGDGACDEGEDCGLCPEDCGACPADCGNGEVEAGETCDPPSTCPVRCDDDGDPCTRDVMTGTAASCDAECTHPPITDCQDGDDCCPEGCDGASDGDCNDDCGNGVIDFGEECDPPSNCPQSCNDGDPCTQDRMIGHPSTCDALCMNELITSCVDGDGCCAPGCDGSTDSDCSSGCGDGVVDSGEYCDPPSSCPTSCSGGGGCSPETLVGSASNCTARCEVTSITTCTSGDGCCPTFCDETSDDDCSSVCGNGVCEPSEEGTGCSDCQDDPCLSAPSDGHYCGESLVRGSSGVLYYCIGGTTASQETCPDGCVQNEQGVADECASPTLGTYGDSCTSSSDCDPSEAPNCGPHGYCCVGSGGLEPGAACGRNDNCCSGNCHITGYCCWETIVMGGGCTFPM